VTDNASSLFASVSATYPPIEADDVGRYASTDAASAAMSGSTNAPASEATGTAVVEHDDAPAAVVQRIAPPRPLAEAGYEEKRRAFAVRLDVQAASGRRPT
jgi:hypothetical protein